MSLYQLFFALSSHETWFQIYAHPVFLRVLLGITQNLFAVRGGSALGLWEERGSQVAGKADVVLKSRTVRFLNCIRV